jgi:16S rRNA (guanine527-N7)-methyltransferase
MAELLGPPPGPFLDLGTGAGIPGLVLALSWPNATGVLLDSRGRRAEFLTETLTALGLADRFRSVAARAEDAGRDPELRGHFALVVARGFGAPAVTAECAVAFLEAGGALAVSEPPDTDPGSRWPAADLAQLGFAAPEILRSNGTTVARLTLPEASSDKWPRRPGIPNKRPLW